MNEVELYHPLIIQRNKNPKYYDTVGTGAVLKAYNPVCGDEFEIRLQVEDEKIAQISFSGYGCAISKAAIDLIAENILHKDKNEALSILEHYFLALDEETSPKIEEYPLAVFQKVKKYPARYSCATLGATVLLEYLRK